MSALSDLLKEANDREHMSIRARAARIGNRLHFATIGDYQRGDHPADPSEDVLQALSEAYRIPLSTLQHAASVQVGAGEWSPPAEITRLTARQQQAITELILAIAKGGAAGWHDTQGSEDDDDPPAGGTVTPLRPDGPPDIPPGAEVMPDDVAAYDATSEDPAKRGRREQDEAAERGDVRPEGGHERG